MTDARTDTAEAPQPTGPLAGAPLSGSAAGEWIASRYADIQAVLADDRFEVPAAPDTGAAAGTISWLRASVSRFANGTEHARRRARAVEELNQLDPEELRSAARKRANAELSAAGLRGARVDVMAALARRVPMATMAASLGFADPRAAANAVTAVAAGYFGGADPQTQLAADAATALLVSMLGPVELDVIVARITLMVQACDATAGLIGIALQVLQDGPRTADGWTTDAVLNEVVRHSSPVRLSRRVARVPVDLDGRLMSAGDTMLCNVDAANRDPAAFDRPDHFDPARQGLPSMTFGFGVRPCPGQQQALMLAGGVVDAVRERCEFQPGQRVWYEPSAALRIPKRLEVALL